MKMLLNKIKPVSLALGLAIATTAVATVPAQASQTDESRSASKVTVAGKGAAKFDWMASSPNEAKIAEVKLLTRAPIGSGRWVCSPAGFGKQASCFRR